MQDIAFLDQADGVMQKIMRGIWCFGAHNVCVALKQHRFLAFATILPIFPDDYIIYIIPPDTQTAFSGKGKQILADFFFIPAASWNSRNLLKEVIELSGASALNDVFHAVPLRFLSTRAASAGGAFWSVRR